jgi:GMP synthase (glutamine-hydrolysing)
MEAQILIIDFGSQYTLVIGRTLREIGVRSVIMAPSKVKKFLEKNNPKAIILSGSNYSVTDDDAPRFPYEILEENVPILGICYGLHLIADYFGGELFKHVNDKEYGPAEIFIRGENPLFKNIVSPQKVWASHGDSVIHLPAEFTMLAESATGTKEAIVYTSKNIWGIQFHPEVTQTLCGKQLLSNFVFDIAGCEKDWEPLNIIQQIRDEVKAEVGDKKVVIGLSGGVDSTTLAAILKPVLGDNLLAVCIDRIIS